jgi:VWFA-related protein
LLYRWSEQVKEGGGMKKVVVSLIAAAILAGPALSAPVSTTAPAQSSFGESIDVRVVNVEAVVTDRRGKLVEGLSAADFRLLVDGKEVPITYFTEVQEGEMATPPVQEGAPAPAISLAPDGKVGTSYLIFIDDSFSIQPQRNIVLRRLAEGLKLRPEDEVAVVAYDGRRIDLLTGWTSDRGTLRQTLAKAQQRPAEGVRRLATRRSEDVGGELGGVAGPGFSLYPEIEAAVAAAAASMRGVAVPSGRKVFLLLSGGWPVVSEGLLLSDPNRDIPSAFYTPRPEELFEVLTDTANLLGYTIYPVDVQGLDPDSNWADVRNAGASTHGFITSEWERATHESLFFMAEETGGKAVLNSARLTAFERVAKDTRSYYWLGFTPEWQANDQRHEIKVEVRRPGLKTRARESFNDLSRETRAQLRTESLLLFGGGEETGRIRVRAGEARKAGFQKIELPVTLEIPAGALTPLPVEGGYEVRATLSMGSLDQHGSRSRLESIPLRLVLPEAPGPGVYARYETTLKLRRQPQRLVFSVEDATGGGEAWADLDLKP